MTDRMTEAEFQRWVLKQLALGGWPLVFHVLRARVKGGRWVTNTSTPGVPDVWACRPDTGQLTVLELKRSRLAHDAPTADQAAWIAGLQQVRSVEAYVASPEDAEELLHLLARPRPAA